ncbi:hypothetical protein GCM10009799_23320 [Nocardiopsis rhodophaea]|uniref:PIN domain-containing protein n=1 Tax=Nocardiopsis rhodophaea TaxID=280238 RepID=A0ABN2T1E0_9ACTN
MSIVDGSFVIAFFDPDSEHHKTAVDWMRQQRDPVRLPESSVAAIIRHLENEERREEEKAFLMELASGKRIVPISHVRSDFARMADVVETYGEYGIGTAEAGVIAVAERLQDYSIATFRPEVFQIVPPKNI